MRTLLKTAAEVEAEKQISLLAGLSGASTSGMGGISLTSGLNVLKFPNLEKKNLNIFLERIIFPKNFIKEALKRRNELRDFLKKVGSSNSQSQSAVSLSSTTASRKGHQKLSRSRRAELEAVAADRRERQIRILHKFLAGTRVLPTPGLKADFARAIEMQSNGYYSSLSGPRKNSAVGPGVNEEAEMLSHELAGERVRYFFTLR